MLRIFSQIRHTLIGSSGRKYILYAIGEIALVVIGILIALQVNNWNEYRKDRVKEQEILSHLVENLELIHLALQEDARELQNLNESGGIVLSVLEKHQPFVDSMARHFHQARVPKYPLNLSESGYEQYKNTGYDLIRNSRVKQTIIKFFETALPKWYREYNLVNENYVPFIDYHVPLFIYKDMTLAPIHMDELYDDEYFIGWIRAYYEGRNTLIQMENELIESIQEVLHIVRSEVKKNAME